MRLSLQTLLTLRQACLMLLSAIEAAALEGYGWTPKRSKPVRQQIDNNAILDA